MYDIINIVARQIRNGTDLESASADPRSKGRTFPYAGIDLSGGDKITTDSNSDVLDETLFMTIVVTAESIEQIYNVMEDLKLFWLRTTAGTDYRELVDKTDMLTLRLRPPVSYPITRKLDDKSDVLQSHIVYEMTVRYTNKN